MFFLKTFIKVASLINNYIDKEINDEGKLQQQLLEARLNFEMDEITEEEYIEIEKALIQRISEIKERKMNDQEEEE